MRFFKEIWTFVRLLFTKIDMTQTKLEPWGVKYILGSGYKYMTWCGKVMYHLSKPDTSKLTPTDENHENIHLRQAQDKGSWIKYYWGYIWEWIKGNPFSKKAYYTNKNEVEAYAKEEDLGYLFRRPKDYVEKYKLSNRKEEWKNGRSISYFFKRYIKEKYKDL